MELHSGKRKGLEGSDEMIKWKRIEAGEYESEDNRFHITKTWDRIYGDHWRLLDRNADDYYKGLYHENTLLDCKLKAETLNKTTI